MAYKIGKCLLPDLLDEARLTQQDLAEILGVTRQQINKYAKNKSYMSLQTAKNIAAVLKCNIDDLYEWIE